MKPVDKQKAHFAIACGILVVSTVLLYWQTVGFAFLTYDDETYVTKNLHVSKGLTFDGFYWAFSGVHGGNWHPLTSISHMLDCEVYGLNPAGHHATNIVLHTLNALLLLALLFLMTGSVWRSATVAGLFALHPLHVESVAWVSERKDVLSGFFFLLTLFVYQQYARLRMRGSDAAHSAQRRTKLLYSLCLLSFACGLMSKPMLVTVPVIMLLLDFWPLKRWEQGPALLTGRRLLLEKTPFFFLSAIVSGITIVAQRSAGTVATLGMVPISARLENAIVAYVRYLGKLFWPENLAVIYPYVFSWSQSTVLTCAVLICVLTLTVILLRLKMPWVAVGWFWFVMMLVPVIGIVQVGEQSMANRYVYLPAIGVYVAVAWTVPAVYSRVIWMAKVQWIPVVAVLVILALTTHQHLRHWKDSVSLFQHALAVTENNQTAHKALGSALLQEGKVEAALRQFEYALALNPDDPLVRNNMGVVLSRMGRFGESLEHYTAALELSPNDVDANFNLGNFLNPGHREPGERSHLFRKNPLKDAAKSRQYYAKAADLSPHDPAIQINLGILEASQGRQAEAADYFLAAIDLAPDNTTARINLGDCYLTAGQRDLAIAQFLEAIRLEPDNAIGRRKLARALAEAGNLSDSLDHFSTLVVQSPSDALAHYELGNALAKSGKAEQALFHLETSIKLRDDFVPALNDLAWLRSTHPNKAVRDGREAVMLAERAAQITSFSDSAVLSTLGAAYAEAGNWDKATHAMRKALAKVDAIKNPELEKRLGARVLLFESHQPYREDPSKAGKDH
jgi:tetratricopeptide (TPR) repeat protein